MEVQSTRKDGSQALEELIVEEIEEALEQIGSEEQKEWPPQTFFEDFDRRVLRD